MAIIKGQPYVVRYKVWNISVTPPAPVTGDAANHSIYVDIDGGPSLALSATITEIDSANRPGEYKFLLPGTHTNGDSIGVSIRSSTPNTYIEPINLLTEQGRIDTSISSRAAPGSQMALVDGAITSAKIATAAIGSAQLAASAVQAIASGILLNPSNKLSTDSSGRVSVGSYATGQSPAEQILLDPANKLYTDGDGYVIASYVDIVNITETQMNDIAGRVWDQPKSAHTVPGTYGVYLDVAISSRMPSGNVTVGGYTSGQDPATLVWSHPSRTLTSFDVSFADVIWNRLRNADTRPAGSFGYYLDMAISALPAYVTSAIAPVKAVTDQIQFDSGTGGVVSFVAGYGSGLSPAQQILLTPANKLWTDASGYVTAASVVDRSGFTLTSSQVDEIVDKVWDELKSGHNVSGSYGAYLDAAISSRQPAGPVTVGGYSSGQDPGSLTWSHPQRTLTSVLNVVSGASTTIADQIWNRLYSDDTRPVGSFGYFLDQRISEIIPSGGGGDWTADEKAQIRYALGIDGTQQAPTTTDGYIPAIKSKTDQLQFTANNVNAIVQSYASGLAPSQMILLNPSNKLATDSSGYVTVGSNTDKSGYSLSSGGLDAVANAVWEESRLAHNTPGTYGYFLDAAVSSRMPSGSVTVGGYASGQSPAELILLSPSNRLATDSLGRVTVGSNADKSGYLLDSSQHAAVADAVWDELRASHTVVGSFGEALDVKVSSRHPDAPVSVGSYQSGASPNELLLVNSSVKIANYADGAVRVGGYSASMSPGEQILQDTSRRIYLDGSGGVRVGEYASGKSPSEMVLAVPTNKLSTNAAGQVSVHTNADKSGYQLASTEHSNIASAVWSYILEGGRTVAGAIRIIFSVLAGKRVVVGDRFRYYGTDGTTLRVDGTVDAAKNRDIDSLNGD